MAHIQQQEYCLRVKRLLPSFFSEKLVLDIGSLDVNGNNQDLFDDCLYLGLDIATGKNVDIIVPGHELALPNETFDVVVSTECFEHDRFYDRTLCNIVRLLKPGGLFLFSCATTGRPEHGTLRTTAGDAPLLAQFGDWANYYKNLDEADIRAVLDIDTLFTKYQFEVNEENHDLYFWGIKAGSQSVRTDYSFQVKRRWLYDSLRERDAVIRERDAVIGDLQNVVSVCKATILDRDKQIGERDRTISARDQAIDVAQTELVRLNKNLRDILNSTSWRMTAGLRRLRRMFR